MVLVNRLWGVGLDDGAGGPATSARVHAVTLTEAWVRATRAHNPGRDGTRVMVVFSLGGGTYQEATLLDYSPTTGKGDPHHPKPDPAEVAAWIEEWS